ncbi:MULTISPECIES: GreA/GreB family elongation factor [Mycolicibacterium]|uniref:Transcription elongation factor GreA n=1 Tax=Mycolicibacterium mageritense TaxID=53462 RepID=A0AAI8TRP2_MYCME|nr:GreA/GreB family elongation factor [Mycolicibacterium mageritense]MBN3458356.1 GreA/GreB family elongation factor [Mycobacterium sp. DSM 3803]OKH79978.1 elongation factor GreAB [Mycobacterium sp. SWH-M3]MCC9182898.1 GreA/GreB family elongation factor [Mycolicibacterium mageritense]TXI63355.1 MAG: transcription elongation factor GreAB [Mycolicibacterium mageritense]CDO22197.1 transcription elongation factor GreA [Mycolicibacterium mageritense DSM 44476 = CIP 104973]
MTTSQRVWMSPQAHERLQHELATLRNLLATEAAEDSDENQVAIQRARQARIQHIHDLLLNAVVGEDPPDDGVAEPGMVLTVRFEGGDTETFLLGVRGAEYGDMEVYSVQSPLGAAIVGARPGEQRFYQVPSGDSIPVTLVSAVPFGLHALT